MPRAVKGAARRQAKRRWFKAAKGYQGARRSQWRRVKEQVIRSGVYAYRDRRNRKRDFRALWITRISAACMTRDIRYSRLIAALKCANIELNRKMLSEIAIHDPATFDAIVTMAKDAKAASAKQAA